MDEKKRRGNPTPSTITFSLYAKNASSSFYLLAGMVLNVERFKFGQVDEQVGRFPVIIGKATGHRAADLLHVKAMISLIVIIGSSRFLLLLLFGAGENPHRLAGTAGAPQNHRHHPDTPNQCHHGGQRKEGRLTTTLHFPAAIDF
jgi:hypothetical protein